MISKNGPNLNKNEDYAGIQKNHTGLSEQEFIANQIRKAGFNLIFFLKSQFLN
jgi:hypothetical protein